MRFIIQSLSVFFLTIIFLGTAYGQSGKISGKVVDGNTGEALPFVNVMVEGTTQGAASDIDGYFSIIGLGPGNYNVKASAIGYNSQTVQGVRVSIDLTTEVNFQLRSVEYQNALTPKIIALRGCSSPSNSFHFDFFISFISYIL